MGGFMLLSELCEAKGEAKGRLVGARETLSQLLGLRFPTIPAELLARVDEASHEDVKRWTGRVLTATSPEAVFAPPEQEG